MHVIVHVPLVPMLTTHETCALSTPESALAIVAEQMQLAAVIAAMDGGRLQQDPPAELDEEQAMTLARQAAAAKARPDIRPASHAIRFAGNGVAAKKGRKRRWRPGPDDQAQ
jgi:hypothetical protein